MTDRFSTTYDRELPQRHESFGDSVDVVLSLLPLLLMAVFFYGPRPLVMCLLAAGTARLCDRLVARMRGRKYNISNIDSIKIALIFTLMMPATFSYFGVIFGVMFSVLLAKYAFGGYGSAPFTPAAVGYVAAAISYKLNTFRYPAPRQNIPLFNLTQVKTVDAPGALLKLHRLPDEEVLNMVLGNFGGPMGATVGILVVSCFVFLLLRRRLTLHTSVAFVLTTALFALLFPRVPGVSRLGVMFYELGSGTILFGAVYLVSDVAVKPKDNLARIIYGILVGIMTMLFQYYGIYKFGVCFGVIAVDSFSSLIDRLVSQWRLRQPSDPKAKQGGGAKRPAADKTSTEATQVISSKEVRRYAKK